MQENNTVTQMMDTPETQDLGCPLDMPEWYVIRVTYGRERKLAEVLKEEGVTYFLPTKTVHYNRKSDGKLKKKEVSAIPNIIFLFSTRAHIQALKEEMEARIPMRYMMDRATRDPMIIRKRQMEDFIRLASEDDSLLYLDNPDIVLEKGQPVEVTYGPFQGIQGYVLRIRRDRKVVLVLNGILAAAIKAEIKMEWVKKI